MKLHLATTREGINPATVRVLSYAGYCLFKEDSQPARGDCIHGDAQSQEPEGQDPQTLEQPAPPKGRRCQSSRSSLPSGSNRSAMRSEGLVEKEGSVIEQLKSRAKLYRHFKYDVPKLFGGGQNGQDTN